MNLNKLGNSFYFSMFLFVSIMEDFMLQINQTYSKYKDRLIMLGVSQDIIKEVGTEIIPDQAMGWFSDSQIIKLDALLTYVVKDSRQRFSNVEKFAHEQIQDLLESDSKEIHRFFEDTTDQTIEPVVEYMPRKLKDTSYNLLKTIIKSNPNFSGKKKTKTSSQFEIKGTNKFPKTEFAVNTVSYPSLLTSKIKRAAQYKRRDSLESIDSHINPSASLTTRTLQTQGNKTKEKFFRSSSCADLDDTNCEEIADFNSRNNSIKSSVNKCVARPMSGGRAKSSKKSNRYVIPGPFDTQCYVSSRESIKNSIEASRAREGKDITKSSKKEVKNPMLERLYQQLLSENSHIKKSIDKYSSSYSIYSQKKDYPASLDHLDESTNGTSVICSETRIFSFDDRQIDQHFLTPIKDTANSTREIFNFGYPSALKKRDSKTESKKNENRTYIPLPKLNIMENLSINDQNDSELDKRSSGQGFGKKLKVSMTRKHLGASRNMILNCNPDDKIEAHEKAALLASVENIFKRDKPLDTSIVNDFSNTRTQNLANLISRKTSELTDEKIPVARTTVGRFTDLQNLANKSKTGPCNKKSKINIKQFCTPRVNPFEKKFQTKGTPAK